MGSAQHRAVASRPGGAERSDSGRGPYPGDGFCIQHTQAREQAATQRKLDEILQALPGADNSLLMLEHASLGVDARWPVSPLD